MKTLFVFTFLLLTMNQVFACQGGKGHVRANAEVIAETAEVKLFKLTHINYRWGCLLWGVSGHTNKNKICRNVLGKGHYRGQNSYLIPGKISYLKGSKVVSNKNDTVLGFAGINEMICVVDKG